MCTGCTRPANICVIDHTIYTYTHSYNMVTTRSSGSTSNINKQLLSQHYNKKLDQNNNSYSISKQHDDNDPQSQFNPCRIPSHLQLLTARSTLLYCITGGIILMCITGVLIDCYVHGIDNHELNTENILFCIYVGLFYCIQILSLHMTTYDQYKHRYYIYAGFIVSLMSVVVVYNIPERRTIYRYIMTSNYALCELRWIDLIHRLYTTQLHTYNIWYRAIYCITFCDISNTLPLCDQNELDRLHTIAEQRQYMVQRAKTVMISGLIWLHIYMIGVVICGTITVYVTTNLDSNDLLQLCVIKLSRYILGYISVVYLLELIYHSYVLLYIPLGVIAHPVGIDVFNSKSITELWGTRWNTYIQPLLKYNIYIPLVHVTHNKSLSGICTFMFSGIFIHCIPAYMSGLNIIDTMSIALFFISQAIIIAAERIIFNQPIHNTFINRSRTKFILLCTVPLAIEPIYKLCGI